MNRLTKRILRGLLVLSLGGLAACTRNVLLPLLPATPAPPPTVTAAAPPTATALPPAAIATVTPPATATEGPSTVTVTPSAPPDLTPANGGTPAAAPSPTEAVMPAPTHPTLTQPVVTPATPGTAATPAAGEQQLRVFLIAVGDNGKSGKMIGCGDSAVPVIVLAPKTSGVLKASLQALLDIRQQNYGASGLYDALYSSDLKVQSVALRSGTATIYLTGTLTLGGECDNPRVQAQLEQTALQFSTVKQVAIYINGKTLAQALSLK